MARTRRLGSSGRSSTASLTAVGSRSRRSRSAKATAGCGRFSATISRCPASSTSGSTRWTARWSARWSCPRPMSPAGAESRSMPKPRARSMPRRPARMMSSWSSTPTMGRKSASLSTSGSSSTAARSACSPTTPGSNSARTDPTVTCSGRSFHGPPTVWSARWSPSWSRPRASVGCTYRSAPLRTSPLPRSADCGWRRPGRRIDWTGLGLPPRTKAQASPVIPRRLTRPQARPNDAMLTTQAGSRPPPRRSTPSRRSRPSAGDRRPARRLVDQT